MNKIILNGLFHASMNTKYSTAVKRDYVYRISEEPGMLTHSVSEYSINHNRSLIPKTSVVCVGWEWG